MRRLAQSWTVVALLLAACSGGDGQGGGDDDGHDVDSGAGGPSPDGGPATVVPDPCEGQAPECPAQSGVNEGSGLAPIDRCAFPMQDTGTWGDSAEIVNRLAETLGTVSVADVLGDLNRVGEPIAPADLPGDTPGVETAFAWQSGDESVAYWIPQGITGSGDGVDGGRVDGRRVLLVSWYHDAEEDPGSGAQKGVRIALVNATDPADIRYRFLLLVEPSADGDRPTFGPVAIHAGGVAWVGDLLYVVNTTRGLRAFDLTRILPVETGKDVIGHDAETDAYYAHEYAYAVPQIGMYQQDSSCEPRFSWVALDRSTSPPSLVTGEYDAESVYGRIYRWPLDGDRLRLVGDAGRVVADQAWFSSHSHLQGGLSREGSFWLSSSKPTGAAGVLYRTAEGSPSESLGWSDTPEDLSFNPTDGLLWSLSEGLDARHVFSLPLDAVN